MFHASTRFHAMSRRSVLALALGLSITAALGCQMPKGGHEKAVNNANARWHTLRSGSMLKLAQQQFDTGDLDQSEKTLVDAISIDASNPSLYILAGRIAIERGQLERAVDRFDNAIELDPKKVSAYYYKGVVLQRWRQYDNAYDCYAKAYELQDDNIAFLLAMSEMHVSLDRRDEAIALLESKVVIFDQNASIRSALGQLYYMDGQYEKAVHYLKQAAYLAPDNLVMLENLAGAQLAAGEHAQAVDSLERLVEEPANAHRPGLKRTLAVAYEKAGRLSDARAIYVKITREDPRDVEAWTKLAGFSLAANDLDGALAAARRVMSIDGSKPEGFMVAALVMQHRGQYDQAIRLFDRAASLSPKNPEPVILRGIALEKAGQADAAAAAYTEALRRNPEDARAKNLLERLSAVDSTY